MTRITGLVMTVLAMTFFLSCGKAPEMEMKNADDAIQFAVSAEAEQYAPEAYKMAMDTLNSAKAEAEKQSSKFALLRSYGKAKELYISAETLAKNASSEANAEKERIQAEVAEAMGTVQALLDSATAMVGKAPRGKGSKADIELIKVDLNAATSALSEAKMDFDNGKYLVAQTKLEAVSTKANAIIGEINKALAMKRTK